MPDHPTLSVSDTTLPEPALWMPVSQACTQSQMEETAYRNWCTKIDETPNNHRKQWEFCYILQALTVHDMIREGRCGLGFGVGMEPLAAVFADSGVSILATDLEPEEAMGQGWVESAQYAQSKLAMNDRNICDQTQFDELVEYRYMDMNAVDPAMNGQFDFVWSSCAFEHLGSIHNGLEFVVKSAACLKPGGVAVHTTEFNCSSDRDTVDNDGTVLFRKRDFLMLQKRLALQGYDMEFNFNLGDQPLDTHIDVAPYRDNNHLKLLIGQYAVTSFGLIIRRPPEG